MSSLRIIIRKFRLMDINSVIDNEESRFIYVRNVFPVQWVGFIKKWAANLPLYGGTCISGKEIPRLQVWYHQGGHYFCDNWKVKYDRWRSEQYDAMLSSIQSEIERKVRKLIDDDTVSFNSCLVNYYRDNRDSIKPHRDNFDSFGMNPIIANYSIGSTRTIVIKKIKYSPDNIYSMKLDENENHNFTLELEHNSLFIMMGASQKHFTHEIPASPDETLEPRFSLTFRKHLKE